MPGGFTEEEKEQIIMDLIEEGTKLFSIYGLKKTTIRDLTKAVGISQGSFYNFFNSKEELYFKILDIEGQKLRQDLMKYAELVQKDPRKGLKKILLEAYTSLEKNDLFKDLFSENTYELLVRKLPEEKIDKHIKMDFSEIKPLIKEGQEKDIIKNKNPEAITGILHSLFFITLHKDDIGEKAFNNSFKLLIDLIVDGLVKDGENK
ncbi:MAG: TetR/AcrR family transcriptional regulator [Halanaerobiales bacterium]|nr:TetR/AcrR family transcriptional regulator [Halanaerobiales bacterium]